MRNNRIPCIWQDISAGHQLRLPIFLVFQHQIRIFALEPTVGATIGRLITLINIRDANRSEQ